MTICVVDWNAVAAWVQAIGSIGAIFAAIWIGEKQHRQNVELVEHEQRRVNEEEERKATEEGRSLKELVMIVIDSLMTNTEARLQSLQLYRGRIEPLPSEIMQHISDTRTEAHAAKKQLTELREVFLGRPLYLLTHGHLISALNNIASACDQEDHYETLRQHRIAQIAQAPFNGPHVQIGAGEQFNPDELANAVNHLKQVFTTVGR